MRDIQFTSKSTFEALVFFYCCERDYPHLSICIAEGLKQLGISFYSNRNYWRISPDREDYLFCYNSEVTPDDCDIVVVEYQWILKYLSLPENLFHKNRKYITVYLDAADGPFTAAWHPDFRNFDLIFRTHCNSKSKYPANFVPWAFGLSNRILIETSEISKFSDRSKHLLVNFRVNHEIIVYTEGVDKLPGLEKINATDFRVEYPLRQIARNQLYPLIKQILPVDYTVNSFDKSPSDSYHYLNWQQTGQRHNQDYYQRLKATAACAAFGGYLVPATENIQTYVEFWDSWRFWESLAAGCVAFHVDFEKYNIVLPVMQENWRHYIGIDLDNLEDTVDRIVSNPEILEDISIAGREWALNNYGPLPTAIRFLEMMTLNPLRGNRCLQGKGHPVTLLLPVHLREINLIMFPNWSKREDLIGEELARVFGAIATHPDKTQMTLLIDTSNISDEDADAAISGVIMSLLMEEDLDIDEGTIIGQMSERQWEVLLPRIHSRIGLENENQEAIARVKATNLPCCKLNNLPNISFLAS